MPPSQPGKKPIVAFVVVCALAIAIAVGYFAWSRGDQNESVKNPPAPEKSSTRLEVQSQPHLLYRDTSLGPTHGRLVLESLRDPLQRYTSELSCERVHFAAGSGVCLVAERGFATVYRAVTFDEQLAPRHSLSLAGVPSRVRVSPDGRRAGITVFVSGDSYAPGSFSTRTTILDIASGTLLGDLEQYTVLREGKPFKAIDFNFWGVTFSNQREFFATLGTGGKTYLVRGDAETRTARVLHEDVECPSLSPDLTRLVFKKRMPGARLVWKLHVLTLDTLAETALAEERSVDDQADWLDSETVVYGLPSESKPGSTDVWRTAADGSGRPTRLISAAWSPAVVRAGE